MTGPIFRSCQHQNAEWTTHYNTVPQRIEDRFAKVAIRKAGLTEEQFLDLL